MVQRSSITVALFLSLFIFNSNANAATLACKYIDAIERSFLHQHVTFNALNENIENRTIDQYIKRLDPAEIYLLKSDLAVVKQKMKLPQFLGIGMMIVGVVILKF